MSQSSVFITWHSRLTGEYLLLNLNQTYRDITLDDFTKKEDGVGDGDGLDDGGFDYGE